MTEAIDDMRERIALQTRNHKTRSGLQRRLVLLRANQLEEEMFDPTNNPQVKADMAVNAVTQAAILLKEARMNNKTADYILEQENTIAFAVTSLLITLDDIKQANANMRSAAE